MNIYVKIIIGVSILIGIVFGISKLHTKPADKVGEFSTDTISGSGTITSIATNNGVTGGTITNTGTIGLDTSSLSTNAITAWNGSKLVATGTPQLTVGNILATSTTLTSVIMNPLMIQGGATELIGSTQGFESISSSGANPTGGQQLTLVDTSAMATGVGAELVLSGQYSTGPGYTGGAIIKTEKTNASNGNYSFNLGFFTRFNNATFVQGGEQAIIMDTGAFGVGVTPTASSTVAFLAGTNNGGAATTTVTIGNTNKRTCLEVYNTVGTAEYITIVGTTLTVSATSCK